MCYLHEVTEQVWLRSPRFDVTMQVGALLCIAPALVFHATLAPGAAATFAPLVSLIAIPFLHVFGSFFFAFSAERNRSASRPRALAVRWAVWAAAALALQVVAPRGLATFALLYGGWHILRQNFGFLREVAVRAGRGADPLLRKLDHAVCIAPAIALWLLLSERGPWSFFVADIYHVPVPTWLLATAFTAVFATVILRQLRLGSSASLLLMVGNAAALLGPALFLDDLTLIYTLSASFHGFQYLAYLVERERERQPDVNPTVVILPLAQAIVLSTAGMFVALMVIALVFSPAAATQVLLVAWYAIVPFHYFVDGKIWRRPRRRVA
jgi:hypothetical protein